MKLFEKCDFVKTALPKPSFDVINCLEVLEHVEADHAYAMMQRMNNLLKKDGVCFLSTPCYDMKMGAAANHVNEMTYDGFMAIILSAGFKIEQVWGTFASQKDYKALMSEPELELFQRLATYYDSNIVSCLMAPLFPQHSRNCLWRLRKGKTGTKVKGLELTRLCNKMHGSSKKWATHLRKIMK